MLSFVIHWIVLALALWLAGQLVPGVSITSYGALAIGAIVLSVVNAIVRPVLTILTLPLTVLTLGLFYLVVNGLAFGLAAALVPGFSVSSLLAAMAGAFVTSVAGWVLGEVLSPARGPRG